MAFQCANYQFLSDGPFTLKAGTTPFKRFNFKCPVAGVFDKATAFPILWWKVWPRSSDCKFIVLINDLQGDPNNIPANKIIIEMETDTKVARDIHEIVNGSMFNPGVDNQVDFRVVIGEMQFSDVVMLHRIQVSV